MDAIKERVISDFCDAALLENFRIMSDGTLERREGYEIACACNHIVRGAYVFGDVCYMVGSKTLYVYENGVVSQIGVMGNCTYSDNNERVLMFEYGRLLHIIGGGCYYIYDIAENRLYEDDYYTPLYRYQDDKTGEHTLYESLNMVNSTVIVHHLVSETETKYLLPGQVESVVSVLADGQSFTRYKFVENYDNSHISVDRAAYLSGRKELLITYRLKDTFHPVTKDSLFRNKRGFVTRIDEQPRLFLFDPDDTTGTVYYSELAYGTDKKAKGTFDYFTKESFFTVGDGATPVWNMGNLSDHTFLFNDDEIYELEKRDAKTEYGLDTLKFGCKLTTNDIGISKNSGIVMCDGAMYIINSRGLFRCSYNKFTYDFISASIDIPRSVIPDMDKYKDVRLFLYRRYDELWLQYENRVAVYNLRHSRWYLFTGIQVKDFALASSDAMFFDGRNLFAFSAGSSTDNGAGISAVCETAYYGLPNPAKCKTLYTFGAAFDNINGAELKCTVTNDRGDSAVAAFTADGAAPSVPAVKRIHTRLKNSSLFVCRLESVGGKPPANIRAVILRYRETGGRQ